MGCLVNLFKCFLGIIVIVVMLIVGYELIFNPYRPESPNSCWSHKAATEMANKDIDDGEYQSKNSIDNINYDVPTQEGPIHDYIMENTFQKPGVMMSLAPELEQGLVVVIQLFKAEFGEDFSPTITSAHDSFHIHDRWSSHRYGRAVDIRLNDLPLNPKRRLMKALKEKLPEEYSFIWEDQGIPNEHLHFQYRR